MNEIFVYLLAGLFGWFLYGLCRGILAIKRRIQLNRDRERYLKAMRPNESDVAAMQDYFAQKALLAMTTPKKKNAA